MSNLTSQAMIDGHRITSLKTGIATASRRIADIEHYIREEVDRIEVEEETKEWLLHMAERIEDVGRFLDYFSNH